MNKGKISIHRFQSSEPPYHGVSIEVIDESSSVKFLDVQLTPEQFGNAISGSGDTECLFELRGVDLVGKRREHYVEHIYLDGKSPYGLKDDEIRKMIEPYETEGWMGRDNDLANPHNYDQKTKSMRVSFVRYVDTV